MSTAARCGIARHAAQGSYQKRFPPAASMATVVLGEKPAQNRHGKPVLSGRFDDWPVAALDAPILPPGRRCQNLGCMSPC